MFPETAVPPMNTGDPAQMVVPATTEAAGIGLTVTLIELEFEQPFVPVSVTVYVVVLVGCTDGLDMVDVNPDGVLPHAYVSEPTDDAPMVKAASPTHTVDEEPAFAAGSALVVIVTLFELLQPPALVSVRVYVVADVGDAVGLKFVDELKAVEGDHE